LELLHASALVHDDYMDASDTRRGRPSAHRAFEKLHRANGWSASAEQYGASAILLGDLLLSLADELLCTSGLPSDRILRALRYFDLTRSEVVLGQFLDISAQARGANDVDTAMKVVRYKSAKYSIERPLHVGAALLAGLMSRSSSSLVSDFPWAKPSSCATTCSGSSVTPKSPASLRR
jgi:geranylgeranyl diphosphate synthase type I